VEYSSQQGDSAERNQLIKMKIYTITERIFTETDFKRLEPVTIQAKTRIAALRQFFGVEKPVQIMGGDFNGDPLWADAKGRLTRRATIKG